MPPRDALAQIAEIRQQLAIAGTYRGFRSAAVATTGLLAITAAILQPIFVTNPMQQVDRYLAFWLLVAVASAGVTGAAMIERIRRTGSRWERDLAVRALECVAPSLLLGAWVTVVIAVAARSTAWILPGFWALLFSLGVFAARRLLSPYITLVAGYYAIAGLIAVGLGDEHRLAPWTMGATFGVGQLFAAAVLFLTLERDHEEDA